MEIYIYAPIFTILGLIAGLFIGFYRKQGLMTEIEVLQKQVEHEKVLADTAVEAVQKQMEELKSESRLNIEELKKESANLIDKTEQEWRKRVETAKNEALDYARNAAAERDKAYRETLDAKEKAFNDLLTAQEKRSQEAIASQQKNFDEIVAKVKAQMQTAADEMLKQRQKEFSESSNLNLGQIVNPLKETIEKMKQTMLDGTLKQTEISGEMKAGIENMMKHSEAARQSADELTKVLKHRSKAQGDWGETILNELLESQGFTRGVHYETQSVVRDAAGNVIKSDEGSSLRPDVILHLDKYRDVIIDSKVSLTAFMDYVNAEREEEKQAHLKAHIESIQKHVKELSAKDYSSYIQAPKSVIDYVIMFVPHTGALWTALNAQPDLWRRAMEKNVFIADEQTLFAALRIINMTWVQIAQAQNHEKVYSLANEMLDRVGQFMKKYQTLGKALENANKAYEEGERKLLPTGQSILQTCVKLEKLGARQSDKNPLGPLAEIVDNPDGLVTSEISETESENPS